MEIRASFRAATLNLATNVAKSVEDSIGIGGVEMVIDEVKMCVITKKLKKYTCVICFFRQIEFHVNVNV